MMYEMRRRKAQADTFKDSKDLEPPTSCRNGMKETGLCKLCIAWIAAQLNVIAVM